ncbi:MAG: SDR family oxidoreductase [Candidatus Lindowbacteria bacterium]|nr:SDR family oxidoreductase [Candidatus Lindowbacteria bacterium]
MGMFSGKTAIVTGGASGIGKALGQELASRGANVILADVNAKLLEDVAGSMSKAGHKVHPTALDVCDFAAVRKLVEDTTVRHGRLDYLFNNAGIGVGGAAHDFSFADWKTVIDTNLYGVVNGVAVAYPIMVKQGFGHIINTASLAGLIPAPGEISYAASKYGVVGLSHVLRIEGERFGVRVSVVCPGFIETQIFYNAKLINLDRKKMIDALPRCMPVEECAREILHGVERNKPTIVVTRFAKVLWLAYRFWPSFIFWLGRRYAKRMSDLKTQ